MTLAVLNPTRVNMPNTNQPTNDQTNINVKTIMNKTPLGKTLLQINICCGCCLYFAHNCLLYWYHWPYNGMFSSLTLGKSSNSILLDKIFGWEENLFSKRYYIYIYIYICVWVFYPTPLPSVGCSIRSMSKWNTAGLNLEFFFS